MELYIHIPFCKKKCKYCDFLSFDNCFEQTDKYISALKVDITESLKQSSEVLETIYFGGGTPGIISEVYICEILDTVRKYARLTPDAEITIELNPCTVNEKKATAYIECGINRVSMGVQSFSDSELKVMGRVHDSSDIYKAYYILRNAGFNNISMDLIQGLPGQTVDEFLCNLNKVIELSPEHISCYELIIEEGTEFYESYGPQSGYRFDEDVLSDIYLKTVESLEKSGYVQYEVSNFSKSGFVSRHNSGYWTGKPYIGCGLGAVGYIGDKRYTKSRSMQEYLSDPMKCTVEVIGENEKKQECIFLGMRMNQGINLEEYKTRFGEDFDECYGNVLEKYMPEFVIKKDGSYRFTAKGFLVSNIILAELI